MCVFICICICMYMRSMFVCMHSCVDTHACVQASKYCERDLIILHYLATGYFDYLTLFSYRVI